MHAEKPNNLSHAKLLLGKLRQARVHDTLRCCSEGGACTAITCHGQTEDHRHARTFWVHIEAYLPHQPGHVGCMALRRKPHLCSEALNPRCELALPLGAALASAGSA